MAKKKDQKSKEKPAFSITPPEEKKKDDFLKSSKTAAKKDEEKESSESRVKKKKITFELSADVNKRLILAVAQEQADSDHRITKGHWIETAIIDRLKKIKA